MNLRIFRKFKQETFMKKTVSILLCLVLFAGVLTGCGSNNTQNTGNGKLKIVTTIFPEYDWVRQIIGEKSDSVDLTVLINSGVDLHSFQPTADDIIKISTCDIFIYVGGESDSWVDDALAEATNDKMIVIDLLDVLGDNAKEEETVDGMEAEEEEEEGAEEGTEEGPEYDEHVWLSLKNAAVLVDYISDKICKADPENAQTYAADTNAYIEELKSLDAEYKKTVDEASVKTLLFGDRFPFRYMVDDYGLDYYAAFAGCSAESEASFETVTFLAGKVDELGLKYILQTESAKGNIAETVKNTAKSDPEILTMDSMQSVIVYDGNKDTTYVEIMKKNLDVLKEALS